jgi:hypothetical protein
MKDWYCFLVDDLHDAISTPVISFLRDVYNLRPTLPRYTHTWDVEKVLSVLRKLSLVKHLSLKDLTMKLCMLIALTNAASLKDLTMKLCSNGLLYLSTLLHVALYNLSVTSNVYAIFWFLLSILLKQYMHIISYLEDMSSNKIS